MADFTFKILLLICALLGSEAVSKDVQKSKSIQNTDTELLERYRSQVCSAVPSFGSKGKLAPLLDEMTEDEVFELTYLNMAYGLNSDSISHLVQDLGYKKRIIDVLSFITKRSCSVDVVPEAYLNAAKNLFLYYLYKRNKVPLVTKPGLNTSAPVDSELQWSEILSMLDQCSLSIEPVQIAQKCDDASSVLINGEYIPIGIVDEQIDIDLRASGHEFLDEIIDAVWHMFSISYARCYTMYYPREDWVVQLFDNFREEFLHPLAARWKKPGPMAEFFPLIFGPLDFRRARLNLRACKSAAYMFEGISQRQLVRPLTVVVDSVTMYNFKAEVNTV